MPGSSFDSSPVKAPAAPPSSSPAPIRRSSAVTPIRNGTPAKQEVLEDLEEEEEDQGFDLTRYVESSIDLWQRII